MRSILLVFLTLAACGDAPAPDLLVAGDFEADHSLPSIENQDTRVNFDVEGEEEPPTELHYVQAYAGLPDAATIQSQAPFSAVDFHIAGDFVNIEIRVTGEASEVLAWQSVADFMPEGAVAMEGQILLNAPATRIELRSPVPIDFARFELGQNSSEIGHENGDAEMPEGAYSLLSAHPGRWIPPGAVVQIANTQYVGYTGAPSRCTGTFLPGTREVANFLKKSFPGAVSYGGYSCRRNTASPSQWSVHASGRAIDLFVPLWKGQADNDLGDPIANYLISHAKTLGIEYVIWDRTSWGAYRGAPKHQSYGGPHPHHDHLHIELSPASASRTGRNFPSIRGEAEVDERPENICDPTPVPEAASEFFKDLPDGKFGHASARILFNKGITNGCSDNPRMYCPDCRLTRAHMAAFLTRAAKLNTSNRPDPGFKDVGPNHRFRDEIHTLAALGITKGCGDGKFCPAEGITRGQMAAFLARTLRWQLREPTGAFNDVPATHPFAREIEAMKDKGIARGCGDGNYCPKRRLTRAEAAVFIVRAFKLNE